MLQEDVAAREREGPCRDRGLLMPHSDGVWLADVEATEGAGRALAGGCAQATW